MNKKNHDQIFAQLLKNDRVGEPDKGIENRLMYSFLLKNSRLGLRQNSFASFFGWVFSAQSLGMKTALISIVLFFSVINNQLSFESGKAVATDSLFMQRVLLADTAHLILPIDSLKRDSLN